MDRTLGEVVKLTGAKRRSVQLWADSGVINAVAGTDRAGTGRHRRFAEDEVRLISLLVPLAKLGVPIGWLKSFACGFRKALSGNDFSKNSNRVIQRAARGEGRNYLVFTFGEKWLGFDFVTDENGDPMIDPRMGLSFVTENMEAPFLGVIDISAAFRSLNE